jgi:hypothetical protein
MRIVVQAAIWTCTEVAKEASENARFEFGEWAKRVRSNFYY